MYGEGLRLEGVTSYFGLIAIGMLMLVGLAMLLTRNSIKQGQLEPVSIELQASPYATPRLKNTVVLPITGARVMALDPASFAAADTAVLNQLGKGEKLNAWLVREDAEKWNQGAGRKDFYQALLLQKENGSWVVDYPSYSRKAGGYTSQGWWVMLLGLVLLPYQLIRKPKIPVWISLILLAAAVASYYLWS